MDLTNTPPHHHACDNQGDTARAAASVGSRLPNASHAGFSVTRHVAAKTLHTRIIARLGAVSVRTTAARRVPTHRIDAPPAAAASTSASVVSTRPPATSLTRAGAMSKSAAQRARVLLDDEDERLTKMW